MNRWGLLALVEDLLESLSVTGPDSARGCV